MKPMLTGFEPRHHKVISRAAFAKRMLLAIGLWGALTFGGLVIGMVGYSVTEGMGLADSFVNAAMILSGMGPVDTLHTTAGKVFAGFYAILSGLIIVIGAGFVLAPIAHRMLHRFHVESGRED